MRQYSADSITVNFSGLPLTDGLSVGSMIEVTRNADMVRVVSDGIGGVVEMRDPDQSGEITIRIDESSKEHRLLVTLANASRLIKTSGGPLIVFDKQTLDTHIFTRTSILAIPGMVKSSSMPVHSWRFGFKSEIFQPLTFNANVV